MFDERPARLVMLLRSTLNQLHTACFCLSSLIRSYLCAGAAYGASVSLFWEVKHDSLWTNTNRKLSACVCEVKILSEYVRAQMMAHVNQWRSQFVEIDACWRNRNFMWFWCLIGRKEEIWIRQSRTKSEINEERVKTAVVRPGLLVSSWTSTDVPMFIPWVPIGFGWFLLGLYGVKGEGQERFPKTPVCRLCPKIRLTFKGQKVKVTTHDFVKKMFNISWAFLKCQLRCFYFMFFSQF